MRTVNLGLIGSGFISTIHAEALKRVAGAAVLAVASPTAGRARDFAARHKVPHHFTDLAPMLEMPELDAVVIGCPNDLHCQMTERAAAAGKHVICEKPLAPTLAEADRIIAACAQAGVKLMYAEELCFCPKYVRLKQLVDSGALGRLYLIKQSEKHDGPHSAWFYDVARSGGGVAMDMGCHAVEFFRWMLGKPSAPVSAATIARDTQTQSHETALTEIVPLVKPHAKSVYADIDTFLHTDKTCGEDHALIIARFETDHGEVIGLAEESWAKKGGMDDRAEVHGTEGVAYADLLYGNAIRTFSEKGYDYAVEKAGTTRGWSFTAFEELWNYGFPQEFEHFVDCIANDKPPLETGEDGRAVLEILLAAYDSAERGQRITLPPAKTRP
jgi:predicted dehydrogenase